MTGHHARERIRGAVEAILLVSSIPVRVARLAGVLGVPEEVVEEVLAQLQREYAARGIRIRQVAGGYELATAPEYAEAVRQYLGMEQGSSLPRATLEVLAIVAYRQPISREEVEKIRGARSEHHLRKLLEMGLIRQIGPREGNQPILYGTTERFLRYFGLQDLRDLPPPGTSCLPSYFRFQGAGGERAGRAEDAG